MTEHLGDKYEGVTVRSDVDTDAVGIVRPAGLSLLKEHFEALPAMTEDDRLEKVGLTSAGYAVYHAIPTGRFVYYSIQLTPDGPTLANPRGREPNRSPAEGYGDRWFVSPTWGELA